MPLGVNPLDTGLMREAMRDQSQLLQQLGAQVRQDVQTVQTNMQLRGFSQALQSGAVNPDSPDFGKQAIGLMSAYPMAAKSPLGMAAINQLGAQHKFWQQERLQLRNPYAPVPGADALYNKQTGEVAPLPSGVTRQRPFNIPNTTGAVMLPGGEIQTREELGLPPLPVRDPIAEEQLRQQGRLEVERLRQSGRTPEQAKVIGNLLTDATSKFAIAQSELAKYQGTLNQNPDDKEAAARAAGTMKQMRVLQNQIQDYSNQLKQGFQPQSKASIAPAGASRQQIEAATELPTGGGMVVQETALQEVDPAGDILTVASVAEAMKLPKGTKFRDPQGNLRIVP